MGLWPYNLLCRLVLVAGALGAAPSPAAADITFGPPTDAATNEIIANSPDVVYAYAITNSGKAAASADLSVSATSRNSRPSCGAASRDGCRLGWYVGNEQVFPGTPRRLNIPPGVLELTFRGNAPTLGIYTATATLTLAGKDPLRVSVKVTRKLADFGSNPIIVRSGARFETGKGGTIPVTLYNNAAAAAELPSLLQVQIYRDEGDSKFATPKGPPTQCSPAAVGSEAANYQPQTVQLSPGQTYRCDIAVPSLSPGRYRAEIDLPYNTLPEPKPAAEFTMRWPWLFAIFLLIVGAIGGAVIADWQNSGRRRTLQASSALDLRAKFRGWFDGLTSAGTPDSVRVGDQIVASLDQMIGSLETIKEADFDDKLKALADRLPIVTRFSVLEQGFRQKGGKPDQLEYIDARDGVENGASDANDKLTALEKNMPTAAKLTTSSFAPHTAAVRHWTDFNSGAALRAHARRVDTILLFVSIVLAVLIGFWGLYPSNATWGGAGDAIVALLTGIGATVSGALTLSSLTAKYVLPQLGESR